MHQYEIDHAFNRMITLPEAERANEMRANFVPESRPVPEGLVRVNRIPLGHPALSGIEFKPKTPESQDV